jgi:hypothetical protein
MRIITSGKNYSEVHDLIDTVVVMDPSTNKFKGFLFFKSKGSIDAGHMISVLDGKNVQESIEKVA